MPCAGPDCLLTDCAGGCYTGGAEQQEAGLVPGDAVGEVDGLQVGIGAGHLSGHMAGGGVELLQSVSLGCPPDWGLAECVPTGACVVGGPPPSTNPGADLCGGDAVGESGEAGRRLT